MQMNYWALIRSNRFWNYAGNRAFNTFVQTFVSALVTGGVGFATGGIEEIIVFALSLVGIVVLPTVLSIANSIKNCAANPSLMDEADNAGFDQESIDEAATYEIKPEGDKPASLHDSMVEGEDDPGFEGPTVEIDEATDEEVSTVYSGPATYHPVSDDEVVSENPHDREEN